MTGNEMAVLGIAMDEERLYRHFLRNPDTGVDDIHLLLDVPRQRVERHLARLRAVGLLREGGPDGGTVVPADPESAVARLMDQRLGELHEELQQVTAARRLADSLRAEQGGAPEAARTTKRGVEHVTSLPDIRGRIDDLSFFAREEVLSVEPYTALRPENIAHARPLDLRCLSRGLSMRSIVLREALDDPPTVAYLRELVPHGARIRVVDATAERILVYDRRTAVVPRDPADSSRGALIAHESGLVAHLVALFQRIWDQAEDFAAATDGGGGGREDPALSGVEREVLTSMCSGGKDEVNARTIGVSVRTYRRHVAELMQLLDAGNRAQAALRARDRGWV